MSASGTRPLLCAALGMRPLATYAALGMLPLARIQHGLLGVGSVMERGRLPKSMKRAATGRMGARPSVRGGRLIAHAAVRRGGTARQTTRTEKEELQICICIDACAHEGHCKLRRADVRVL